MKIYRFVPNAKDYSYCRRNLAGKWWPDGIDLGETPRKMFPKYLGKQPYPWSHEGNQFHRFPDEEGIELPDFPALALNLPILSVRAVSALAGLKTLDAPAQMFIDGQRFFAVQPKNIPGVFKAESSSGLAMPEGEIFFYHRRHFDVSKVTAEFFTLEELLPFSDVYFTDRLVTAAAEAGLTGLEYLELVFDEDRPVIPTYPRVDRNKIPELTARRELEYDMLYWRCSMWSYAPSDIEEAAYGAVSSGLLSFEYVRPTYVR